MENTYATGGYICSFCLGAVQVIYPTPLEERERGKGGKKKMAEAKHRILKLETGLTLLFVLVLNGCAQSLPPSKYDGFWYGHHRVDLDSILIEAFFDPVCPDSRDSWAPLKQAVEYYAPRVSVVIHLLPLP